MPDQLRIAWQGGGEPKLYELRLLGGLSHRQKPTAMLSLAYACPTIFLGFRS